MSTLERFVERVQSVGKAVINRVGWVAPLLARVALGTVFIGTGWGKLTHLDQATENFAGWGIPLPHLNAILASATELTCGCLLVAGLASRFASLALTVVMTVAIISAKRGEVAGITDLFALDEFTYITLFLWIAVAGSGPVSVDALIARWWSKRPHSTTPAGMIPTTPLRA